MKRRLMAWLLLAMVAPALLHPGVARAERVKIVIVKPSVRGVVRGNAADAIYDRIVGEIRKMFPCASVVTMDELALMMQWDRERSLFTGGDSHLLDLLGESLAADLLINFSFSTSGTTHESPARHLNTSILDPRQGKALSRIAASGEGWDWSSADVVEQTLEPLRGMVDELCPWLGTIAYRRSVNKEQKTVNGAPAVQMSGAVATTTETYTLSEHSSEDWTFELTRKRLKPVKIKTTGQASTRTSEAMQVDRVNVGCFPRGADGVVRDTGYVSGASQMVADRHEFEGSATAPLLNPKVRLERQEMMNVQGTIVNKPTWSLAVESAFSGPGKGKSEQEGKGGCGNWLETDDQIPEIMRGIEGHEFSRGILFGVDRMAEQNHELSGKTLLENTAELVEGVSWKLTRR